MTLGIEARDVRLRYGRATALDGISLRLPGGKIYGLLGRNGSGKTSLLSVIAAFRRPTQGRVLVGGADPMLDAGVVRQVCLIRESGDVYAAERVDAVVDLARRLRPSFDKDLAARLMDVFELPGRPRVQSLSRGRRSALAVVLGLASRAPLTMFDEVHLGMDVPSRYAFYDALLADYVEHPRTIILSTHLIEEVSRLLEEVVILDHGRVVAQCDADELRATGVTVTGPAAGVEAFVAASGLDVLGEQRLGGTLAVTLAGTPHEEQRRQAESAGLELGLVGLQDLFVHLTKEPTR